MGGLIFVGLGLAGLQDITLRALDAIRSADLVLAEFYTSRLTNASLADLEALVGKKVRVLSREDVETRGDDIVREAETKMVAFVVAGDPMTATTHEDLLRRAQASRIPTRVIPGISIFTAAPAAAGLQIYKFGRTTTLAFPEGDYLAESPYDVVRENRARGLHTLVLLDIQADKDRFMRAPEAVELLQTIEARRREHVVTPETMLVGLARVGAPDARVVYAPAAEWPSIDLGAPLHTLIVPGTLHFMEEEALARHRNGSARSV